MVVKQTKRRAPIGRIELLFDYVVGGVRLRQVKPFARRDFGGWWRVSKGIYHDHREAMHALDCSAVTWSDWQS